MLRLFSRSSYAFLALALATNFSPALNAHGESSMKTRAPSKSREYDRDENGTVDSYSEEYSLGKGLTLRTSERLNEGNRELNVRITAIMLEERDLWTESWNPTLKSRSFTVSRECPFDIGVDDHAGSGRATIMLLDEKHRFVAILVRKKDGRYAPVTEEELARVSKVSETVNEFVVDVLERADELTEDKDEANKVIEKLDEAIEKYDRGADDSTESSIESENNGEESK